MTLVKYISAITVLTLAGCASQFEAMYDHDSAQDFSSYKTYAWISDNPMKVGPSARITNPLLEGRIMSAVENALNAKGYTLSSERGSADFALSFSVGSREEIKVDSYPSMNAGVGYGYPGHWGWGGSYYGYGTETSVRQYTKGMLAIDVFDVGDRRPVWHGVAEKTINESDREDLDGTVNAAVGALLVGFPPN